MSGFAAFCVRMISALFSVIFIPLYGVTYGLDAISIADRTDVSRTNIVGIGAYFRSQGITCDEDSNLYFSSKTTLIKTEADGRTLLDGNFSAIPEELSENYGIKHIGGISWYNGRIYAGMEDSKVWDYPIVGVFGADTLELEEYYIMDSETISRGLPWVAVNPDNGYLYCTDHSKQPTKILVYDTAGEMELVKEVPLSMEVPSIQGAEFYGGQLYAATNDDTQAIYRIDVESGNVEKFLDRNLTGGEGEGMTFMDTGGGTELVAIDMGVIFVNAFVRHYSVEQ